jgi:hypothetical protein
MKDKIVYRFSADIWQHPSPGGWYFVSLPEEITREIRSQLQWLEEGWGRLSIIAKTGNSEWETALWFDSKRNTYVLPLKIEIRKKEKLELNQTITVIVGI